MSIIDFFKTALRSLLSNKTRTFLTVLGMMVGTCSIVVVFSAGQGMKRLVLAQIETFGTNIIETEIKAPTSKKAGNTSHEGGMAIAQGVQITTLTLEDMEKINRIPNMRRSYAAVMSQEQASFGSEIGKSFIYGVSADFIDIDKTEVAEGRFFSDAEDRSLEELAVLGPNIKKKLFGDSEALGQNIKIRGKKFRVIGILKERGAVMGMDFDDFIYTPIRTLQKKIMGIDHVLYLIHELENLERAEVTAADIRDLLRERHDISTPDDPGDFSKDDFRVVTMQEMISTMDTVTSAITLLLLAIVAISLVVGGVGITNVMYVAISERSSEIGLRKAVGARFRDVLGQFIAESVFITILGGVFGTILGVALSFLISHIANNYHLEWQVIIPISAYITVFIFSTIFGIAFGIFPARAAARLNPIEAMRKE